MFTHIYIYILPKPKNWANCKESQRDTLHILFITFCVPATLNPTEAASFSLLPIIDFSDFLLGHQCYYHFYFNLLIILLMVFFSSFPMTQGFLILQWQNKICLLSFAQNHQILICLHSIAETKSLKRHCLGVLI